LDTLDVMLYKWKGEQIVINGLSPITLEIETPSGKIITEEYYNPSYAVYNKYYKYDEGDIGNQVIIINPEPGDYKIRVIPDEDANPEDTYSLYYIINNSEHVIKEDELIQNIGDDPYEITYDGTTDVEISDPAVLDGYYIHQNYPNPFNPSTVIRYGIPERVHTRLSIYNTMGQEIATLMNGVQEAGYYEAVLDAPHLPSGVYIYRLQAGEYVESGAL